jgi:Flp pilus assembly protein TadD
MTCHLVALALLSQQPATPQAEHILTGNGRTLTRVSLVPSLVRARWWHYRLYEPESPALGDGYWGVVEAPTHAKLKETLARMRQQQVTWWSWLGEDGRPEPMPFTSFNALGPIAVMDDAAWSASWEGLGPGAAREIAARKRRLDAARAVEDALYGIFDNSSWRETFERDPFRNEGIPLYEAAWLARAMSRLRTLEVGLRSTAPLPLSSANNDLAELSAISTHLLDSANQLGKSKPAPGVLTPSMSTPDALSLLNGKFTNYTVNAGEGGAGSTAGTMSFSFTETGFSLTQAPPGWYGGMEPVSFSSLDSTTVRYDPLFGGEQRGGIVFLPKDEIRASYRGPSGILLPLGTTPREAESLAQAFRRLVRIGNGIPVAEPPKTTEGTVPDEATIQLVARLRDVGEKLGILGNMRFRGPEIAAKVPPALLLAISKRDGLWRDSEIYNLVSKQQAPNATFSIGDKAVQPYPFMQRLGVPMRLEPIDPPTWHVVRLNRSGETTNIVVRQACQAQHKPSGKVFVVSRFVQETWTDAAGKPKVLSMKLLSSRETEAPRPATPLALARMFYQMAEDHMAANRLPEAERAYRRAVAMKPDWAAAWNSLGVSVVRQGRVDEAGQYCSQSIQINPQFVLGLTNLADIRRVQGKVADSLDLATKATGLAPKDPWAHTVRGHALFSNGDFVQAETEYREAIKLEPGNGANYADLAGALLRQDKKTEATEAASEAIRLGWRTHWVYKELAIPKE